MTKVYNLSTYTEESEFDANTTPEYAVAYCYHQANQTFSRFLASIQDNDGWWQANTPISKGRFSVAAGDFGAMLPN